MEFNHLHHIPLEALRNRLMLLHHFSDLVCSSLAMFDLHPRAREHVGQGSSVALDALRGVLIPSGKVSYLLKNERRGCGAASGWGWGTVGEEYDVRVFWVGECCLLAMLVQVTVLN